MESQATFSRHLLLLTVPAWGHLRPLCAFSSKVIQERSDVAITFLMVGDYREQIQREISRYFSSGEVDFGPKANIRIVKICDQKLDFTSFFPLMLQAFPGYYDNLVNSKPVQCVETKMTFDPIRKPTSIILDFFLLQILQKIRAATGKSIPVYGWDSSYASTSLRIMAPEEFGGFGDTESQARGQAEMTGRKFEDVLNELYHPTIGKVVNVPGLPPMYDYEWHPQEPTPEHDQNNLFTTAYTFAQDCDGFLCVSSATYEAESLGAMRRWLGKTNRSLYAIGPLVPPGFGQAEGMSSAAKQMDIDSSKNGTEFQTFLDKTLKSHGKHSLIYVSFGSIWWPNRNEYPWALVDVLLELSFPFILSHASPKAVIPPGYVEKIKESEIGFLSTWTPQQLILNHPVTGWILTHCGQNTITEALAQGIPMIGWPLDADQPANAAHITLNLDIAFEMIEVRTGPGLKPLHRGGRPTGTIEAVTSEVRSVLQRARGPEGDRKRRNAESIRDKWRKEWEEGGDARMNLRKFLTDNYSAN